MSGWVAAVGRGMAAAVVASACLAVAGSPAAARKTHRRHGVTQAEAAKRPPIPYAYSFYPDEVEDGVSGNLPFNNQIRKFKDPLNANGGR